MKKIILKTSLILTTALALNCSSLLANNIIAFESETAIEASNKHRWQSYSDSMAGGSSEVEFSKSKDVSNKYLAINGQLTTDFFYPFAGVQMLFNTNGTPRDISQFQGIKFKVKGDGKIYKLHLLHAKVVDNNEFSYEFLANDSWTSYSVKFTELKQAEWGRKIDWNSEVVRGVGFHVDGSVMSFQFDIDDIELY